VNRGRRTWAILLAAAAALSGCAVPGQRELDPPTAIAGTPAGANRGTLRVGITQPGGVDPGNAFTPSARLIASTMCDSLMAIDPKTGELRPAIAKQWRVSDKSEHITIKLREGLRYADGTKVTARSMVSTFTRLASEGYASEMAPLLSSVSGYRVLHGEVESDSRIATERLVGVRVTDPLGIEIRLEKNGELTRVLAHPATAPMSPSAEQRLGRDFAHQPVCSGPYRLTAPNLDTDRVIALEAVPGYTGHNTAFTKGGSGYLQRIEFHVYDSESAAFEAYKAGEVDIASVPAERRADARALGDLVEGNGDMVEMIGLPTAAGSDLNGPAVRVAFSLAIDRRRLVRDAFGETRVPAAGYLPPSLGTFHREAACAKSAPLDGNVEEARALLIRTGVKVQGRQMKLYFNDELGHARLASALAAQWREAFGIDVQPTPLTWEAYSQRAHGGAGFDGAFRMSWTGTYSGADAYLGPLFTSAALGSTNIARFNDRLFDRSITELARSIGDDKDRTIGYQKLETLLCEQLPLIPIAYTTSRFVVRRSAFSSATGSYLGVDGTPLLRELWAAS
jgi:oligopeptide transport system substrate-binding protein